MSGVWVVAAKLCWAGDISRLMATCANLSSSHLLTHAGDGFISEDDMAQTLRYLIGSTLAEAELRSVIERTMVAAGADAKGLTFAQYKEALGDTQLALNLEVPTGD